jgi:exo-beta-1,3-glucanase (GH17 family)
MILGLACCWAIACCGGKSASNAGSAAGNSGVAAAGNGTSAAGSPGAGGNSGNQASAGSAGGSAPPLPPVTQGFTGKIEGALNDGNSLWGPGAVALTAPVTVTAGVTLTVNRGTHITGNFPVTVAGGVFKCNGALTEPVTMFGGSLALNGGSHSISYCIFNSAAATAIDVSGATLNASHLQVQRYTQNGVHVHGAAGSLALDFSTLGSTSTLFTADNTAKESVAVLIDADAANGKSSLTSSVLGFLNNLSNTGLKIQGASNTHLAYDNITGKGSVYASSDAPVAILTGDPGISDIPNLDHNLGNYSPDLDQADPAADFAQEPAPNGGRANLGYYGGTMQARTTTVQVLSPNGCEELTAGALTPLTWNSSPNTGPKTIELSTDAGATWLPLAKVPAGMDHGSLSVALPNLKTDQAKIRFSQDNDAAHITDTSDNVFAIGMPKNATACANLRPPCAGDTCKFFKVICYTGYRAGQKPTGDPKTEPTYAQVQEDLTILAKYTHGIRTYGSNPSLHDGADVPPIADALGLELHMGIWIDDTYTDDQNMQAISASLGIVAAGHKSIKSVIVSNEYLLRVRQSFGDTAKAEARLVGYINYVRSQVPKNIEVVIGESGPDWLTASKALYDAVDVVMWHVHPWWQQVAIDQAAQFTATTHEQILARMKALGVSKPERLGETGFPWGQCNGPTCGSEANQAQYLHDLNQYSLHSGLEYWFFEGFDEAWKGVEGGVGSKWGMWNDARQPHPVIVNLATEILPQEMWP